MAALLLCLMPAGAPLAQESAYSTVEPSALATGTISYGALVSMALPGAAQIGDGLVIESDISLPHIEGPEFSLTATAPVNVESIQAMPLSVEGRSHLALMIELAGGDDDLGPVAALALFDMASEPVLVDVKDVGFDRMSGFADPPNLTVGDGQDLILVSNSHGNAGQFYRAITIVDVIDGALSMVDMIMTLDDLTCAGSESQTVSYATTPTSSGRGDFEVTVIDVMAGPEEVCEGVEPHQPSETRYSVTYSWDAAVGRYVAQGEGWAELDDLNGERY